MGTYTRNYNMYKPAKTDYYNIEKDQNANFDILDEELKKVSDKTTNLADTKEDKFSKKSGFNLDKTDNFIDDTNKVLTAKGGNNLFEMIQGNSGIKFDKNLIFLNDAGEKKKGNVYLDRLQNGMFECIQTTSTTVNNSSYFKNFSNNELSNRLNNLFKIEQRVLHNNTQAQWQSVDYPSGYSNLIIMPCFFNDPTYFAVFSLNKDKTKFSFKNLNEDHEGSTAAYFIFF